MHIDLEDSGQRLYGISIDLLAPLWSIFQTCAAISGWSLEGCSMNLWIYFFGWSPWTWKWAIHGHPKRKVFQPSIFRCYVSVRECMSSCNGNYTTDSHCIPASFFMPILNKHVPAVQRRVAAAKGSVVAEEPNCHQVSGHVFHAHLGWHWDKWPFWDVTIKGNAEGPPIVGPRFPYYSHRTPLKYGNGTVWEAYGKEVPFLGIPAEIPMRNQNSPRSGTQIWYIHGIFKYTY